MKKTWRAIGIAAIAAGVLYYPAMRLIKYMAKQRAEGAEKEGAEEGEHIVKTFSPAYRGKHKPHHRHPNGHKDSNAGLAS
jgi:hypothetical protein